MKNKQSGVMQAAASAASKVSGWSVSKQDFAQRVVTSGAFKQGAGTSTHQNGTTNTTTAPSQDKKTA
jgi:hypothetical protein